MPRWLVLAGLIAIAAWAAAMAAACNGDVQPPEPDQVDQTQTEQPPPDQSTPSTLQPSTGFTLEVPDEVVGEHLEATGISVPLDLLLQESDDAEVGALPQRAKASVGLLYQPTLDSQTQETFWFHVITDESEQAAVDWVKYLASQPPSLMRFIAPHPDLMSAEFRPTPVVGDAAVSIQLISGHSGGCWLSELLVFAQRNALVFLKNAIEITAQEGNVEGPALCDETRAQFQLTDIDAIARLISERLSTAP